MTNLTMDKPSDISPRLQIEAGKEHLRELCAQDVEQLAILTQQLTTLIQKQENILQAIQTHQHRIMGILKTEVQLAFTR